MAIQSFAEVEAALGSLALRVQSLTHPASSNVSTAPPPADQVAGTVTDLTSMLSLVSDTADSGGWVIGFDSKAPQGAKRAQLHFRCHATNASGDMDLYVRKASGYIEVLVGRVQTNDATTIVIYEVELDNGKFDYKALVNSASVEWEISRIGYS